VTTSKCIDDPEPLFEKPQKDSSKKLPDVEAASCCQDGVDFVAIFALEVVAVHPVVLFRMADDRLNADSQSVPLPFAGLHALSFLASSAESVDSWLKK